MFIACTFPFVRHAKLPSQLYLREVYSETKYIYLKFEQDISLIIINYQPSAWLDRIRNKTKNKTLLQARQGIERDDGGGGGGIGFQLTVCVKRVPIANQAGRISSNCCSLNNILKDINCFVLFAFHHNFVHSSWGPVGTICPCSAHPTHPPPAYATG